MRLGLLSAVLAAVVAATLPTAPVVSAQGVTCAVNLQSRLGSTLTNPPVDNTTNDKKNSNKKNTGANGNGSSASSGSGAVDVGDTNKDKPTNGSRHGSKDTSGSVGVTPTPSPGATTTAPPTGPGATTTAPPTTSPQNGTPTPTPSPSPTTKTPSSTTKTPSRTPSSGSTTGSAGTTPRGGTRRALQATNNNNNNRTATPDAGTTPGTTPGATPVPTASTNSSTAPGTTTGSGASANGTSATSTGGIKCDESFYKQWETKGIKCGGQSIDVAAAVQAAQCVIYSGTLGAIPGTTCVSMCLFPACEGNKWVYGASNGIASDVYKNVGIASFIPSDVSASVASRTSGAAVLVGNTTMLATKQCAYSGESSFSACSCSALSSNATKSDAQIKKQRENDIKKGVITKDDTTNAGSVLAPTSSSVAGMTVFVSGVAAVASSVVGSASAASASVAAAGANIAVVTVEVCQFGVLINQLNLDRKSAALALFGKKMAPSAFTFLPFGKLDDAEKNSNSKRRLEASQQSSGGVAQYSRTLGIREDMLFLVTLAGVIVVMAGVLLLFGIAYAASGLFMDREDFMTKFFDKMIGLQVLIAILSQYTIGVTGTYQIYYSVHIQNKPTDPKCILAVVALLLLAFGIMIYGYVVVRKHEEDLKDVGTFTHVNKKVCLRYGPLYDEYKYQNRFFFAAKMLLALVSGAATGYVGFDGKYQVSIVLAAHVIFFFYLEVKSPHHSRFVQTTTSFVTIMKIATLALTFFLISAIASKSDASGVPSELQNGISLAIVGLNLFVLFLLMVRSLYTFWKKYQLQRDANYNDEDQSAAQEYFKEETPQRKDRVPKEQNPYLLGGPGQQEYSDNGDDIRLRSGTHMQESAHARSSYEESAPRYDPTQRNGAQHYIANSRDQAVSQQHYQQPYQRRTDVVEL